MNILMDFMDPQLLEIQLQRYSKSSYRKGKESNFKKNFNLQ